MVASARLSCASFLCPLPACAAPLWWEHPPARPTLIPQRLPQFSLRPGAEPATLCADPVLQQVVGADGAERLCRVRTKGPPLEEPGSMRVQCHFSACRCASPPRGQEGTCLAAWLSASSRGIQTRAVQWRWCAARAVLDEQQDRWRRARQHKCLPSQWGEYAKRLRWQNKECSHLLGQSRCR